MRTRKSRRLRKTEEGIGTGAAWSIQVAMPGVSWCASCRKVSPCQTQPWRKFICTQGTKCCYRNARLEYWNRFNSIPNVFVPSPLTCTRATPASLRKRLTKKQKIRAKNLEIIKLVAKRRAKFGKSSRNNHKKPTRLDMDKIRKRNRDLYMQ